MSRIHLLALATAGVASGAVSAADAPLTFNRDVRPILADACFHCHGPDSVTRKADLRLDTEAGFFGKDGGAEAVVIPGKPDESSLYERLITDNPDDLMPPPDSHKELKPGQIEIVRRWIAEGAKWQPIGVSSNPRSRPNPRFRIPPGSPIRSTASSSRVSTRPGSLPRPRPIDAPSPVVPPSISPVCPRLRRKWRPLSPTRTPRPMKS